MNNGIRGHGLAHTKSSLFVGWRKGDSFFYFLSFSFSSSSFFLFFFFFWFVLRLNKRLLVKKLAQTFQRFILDLFQATRPQRQK